MVRLYPYVVAILGASMLLGCESTGLDVSQDTVRNDTRGGGVSPLRKPETLLGGGDILSLGGDQKDQGAQLPVNKYLWRGALDTLAFLPLASTDPYGGVIVTDWGAAPETPNERFKVTAYITSATLRPQSLRVVVNRQIQDRGGAWVAGPVAEETGRKLEDAILVKARQIKVAAGDEG